MSNYFSASEDFLNSKKTRNEGNTPFSSYNCGGYALSTFSWFYPYIAGFRYCNMLHINNCNNNDDKYRTELIFELYEDGFNKDEIIDYLLLRDKNFMLSVFKDSLRSISSPEEANEDEEVIAYRLCINLYEDGYGEVREEDIDEDFHFLVFRDGQWMHKPGSNMIQPFEGDIYKPWVSSVDLVYTGKILFFANKIR